MLSPDDDAPPTEDDGTRCYETIDWAPLGKPKAEYRCELALQHDGPHHAESETVVMEWPR